MNQTKKQKKQKKDFACFLLFLKNKWLVLNKFWSNILIKTGQRGRRWDYKLLGEIVEYKRFNGEKKKKKEQKKLKN